MPYIIEVVQAGKTIEVMKYYSSRYGKKGIKRGKRQNLTKEEGLLDGYCVLMVENMGLAAWKVK